MSDPNYRDRDNLTHEIEMTRDSNNDDFITKLEHGISNTGITASQSIVCAISGGGDSTALLLGLNQLRQRFRSLTATHYNHRSRGQESDEDEEFVRQICSQANIPLQVGRSNRPMKQLDENSARRYRYNFLAASADEASADTVAVAHTLEDQAETVLFRLTRGTGVHGASAMRTSRTLRTPSNRPINIIRPMLKITHREAEEYLLSMGIVARQDTSNQEWSIYTRNRIRHRVMPELQAINPDAHAAISRFAEILKANSNLIQQLAKHTLDRAFTTSPNIYYRQIIASSHPLVAAETLSIVYRSLVDPHVQLYRYHIDKLLDLISTGKSTSYHLPYKVTFWSNHEHISMTRSETRPNYAIPYPKPIKNPVSLPLPGKVDLGDGYVITSEISPLPNNYRRANDTEAWLRLDLFRAKTLPVRNRHPSDRFNPLGMKQYVDLSKFLIKSKVAAPWRDRIPIVLHPDDRRIIWLPGIRIAEWTKISPDDRTALHLRFYQKHDTPKVE